MLRTAVVLFIVAVFAAAWTPTANAYPQFSKAFVSVYASEVANDEFSALVKKAKCYVCHYGKSKKNQNVYGLAVGELIGKADRKDTDKIIAALEEVASKPFDAEDENSKTFAERMAEGLLPGGELDELKKRK